MPIIAKPPDHGLNAEINVTPMVDVMLVLLIIFMVVTATLPFTAELPDARQALPPARTASRSGSTTRDATGSSTCPTPDPSRPPRSRLGWRRRTRPVDGPWTGCSTSRPTTTSPTPW